MNLYKKKKCSRGHVVSILLTCVWLCHTSQVRFYTALLCRTSFVVQRLLMCERQATAEVQKKLDAALEKLAHYRHSEKRDNVPNAMEE
jgi:hypothetical protein